MEHNIYLALGSNLENRLANLREAVGSFTPQMAVRRKSPVYETQPWGYADQPAFLNQVIQVETYLEPQALLGHLKRLETALGRKPNFRNGPRLIDMDILFYDDLILDMAELVIPHPRLHERAFVLAPLADLAPELVHPVLNKSMSDLLAGLNLKDIKLYEGK